MKAEGESREEAGADTGERECGRPCDPYRLCRHCVGYWQRMVDEGLWDYREGRWTEKAWAKFTRFGPPRAGTERPCADVEPESPLGRWGCGSVMLAALAGWAVLLGAVWALRRLFGAG